MQVGDSAEGECESEGVEEAEEEGMEGMEGTGGGSDSDDDANMLGDAPRSGGGDGPPAPPVEPGVTPKSASKSAKVLNPGLCNPSREASGSRYPPNVVVGEVTELSEFWWLAGGEGRVKEAKRSSSCRCAEVVVPEMLGELLKRDEGAVESEAELPAGERGESPKLRREVSNLNPPSTSPERFLPE